MKYCKFCMLPLPNEAARFCPRCGKDLSAPEAEHHLPPGTVVGGKIELGAALGEGGFGITYIGRDVRLDLRVAVKEFYPYGFVNRNAAASPTVSCSTNDEKQAFFEKGRTRFLQEARTLARFSGEPGIVDVRDFFEENNTAYIVMEYLEGETLKQHLKQRGRLSADETLRLLTPVMRSLSKIHKENLIHRDVSPDNIMLTENGVKLLDFGAARFVEGDQKSLSVMLKHGYAPIEQYQSHGNQGPWTDVYALCATMYKSITGVRPQEATDRVLEDKIKTPSGMELRIDPGFEAALMKGLAIRPADRYQSIDDLMNTLNDERSRKKITNHKKAERQTDSKATEAVQKKEQEQQQKRAEWHRKMQQKIADQIKANQDEEKNNSLFLNTGTEWKDVPFTQRKAIPAGFFTPENHEENEAPYFDSSQEIPQYRQASTYSAPQDRRTQFQSKPTFVGFFGQPRNKAFRSFTVIGVVIAIGITLLMAITLFSSNRAEKKVLKKLANAYENKDTAAVKELSSDLMKALYPGDQLDATCRSDLDEVKYYFSEHLGSSYRISSKISIDETYSGKELATWLENSFGAFAESYDLNRVKQVASTTLTLKAKAGSHSAEKRIQVILVKEDGKWKLGSQYITPVFT